MQFVGKKLNFIKLHDFLTRIEVESVHSSLHALYMPLMEQYESKGLITYKGKTFSNERFLEALAVEEDTLEEITLKEDSPKLPEVSLLFKSGNEYVCRLKRQEQFAQIMQFLIEYKA